MAAAGFGAWISFGAAGSGGPIIDFGVTSGAGLADDANAEAFEANCACEAAGSTLGDVSARGFSPAAWLPVGTGAVATGATVGSWG